MNTPQSSSALKATRIISGVVALILLLAFDILYLNPETTATNFAWEIKPPMTALLMGAGYLGGAYFFVVVALSSEWHRTKTGFLAVTSFTIFMFLATLLHMDRFITGRFPFYGWFILYAVTPFLLPWLWWKNRSLDSGKPADKDAVVPPALKLVMRLAGAGFGVIALAGFLMPNLLVGIWPWTLTPLTARVICGWFSLVAVGALILSFDSRWTAWRVTFVSIAVWTALLLFGGFLHPGDFNGGIVNWLTVGLSAQLIGMVIVYVLMESRMRKA